MVGGWIDGGGVVGDSVGAIDGINDGVIIQFSPVKLYCPRVEVPETQSSEPSGLRKKDVFGPGFDL